MMIKDHINLPGFSCQHALRGVTCGWCDMCDRKSVTSSHVTRADLVTQKYLYFRPQRREIRPLALPRTTTPPPAPRKKVAFDLEPLDCSILVAEKAAAQLASSECVRLKYLTSSPKDIETETSIPFLERLWEMYFPESQPRNAYEEAYLSLMRDCIDTRLDLLRNK